MKSPSARSGASGSPGTCYAGDRTGHEMMVTLVERLDGTDVTTLQEYTVIDLLKDGDRVIGAMALDEKGNLVVLKADSTILATGGGTKVYDISTNSSSGTGDGYATGYRAGAELIDMEMIQFHPTGAVFPYDARGRLVTEAVRGEGGLLLNSNGERFMKNYDPQRMELSTRDVVARAIATEIQQGRGSKNGGVLPRCHPPAPGADRGPAPGDARAVPQVRRGHPRYADGGCPDRPPRDGRPPDNNRMPDNPSGSVRVRGSVRRGARCKPARRQCPCRDAGLRPAGRGCCGQSGETAEERRRVAGETRARAGSTGSCTAQRARHASGCSSSRQCGRGQISSGPLPS